METNFAESRKLLSFQTYPGITHWICFMEISVLKKLPPLSRFALFEETQEQYLILTLSLCQYPLS